MRHLLLCFLVPESFGKADLFSFIREMMQKLYFCTFLANNNVEVLLSCVQLPNSHF